MDVVLIPCYRRPEMLWHCLSNIKRAHHADEHHYLFRFDHGFSPELYDVVKGFPLSNHVAETPVNKYRDAKQSWSLISGYAIAARRTDRLVYMVEEDVMVATDFFQYHRAVHAQHPDLFCSIAVANPNRNIVDTGEHDQYYLTTWDYCSLGVCFTSDTLLHDVMPVPERFFINPVDYCHRTFPNSPFGRGYAEQDGLIRRIQWALGATRPIAYPYRAKAYHAGLYGKNRGPGPPGSFQKRLEYVTNIIYSDEAMRTFARHPEWYEDSKPIDLNAIPWTQMQLLPLDPERNTPRV